MKKRKLILNIIGGGLLIYGLLLTLISGWNTGFAAISAIGIILLAGGLFYEKIPVWIKVLALSGLALWLSLAAFLFGYGWVDTVDYQEDAVIVLGAGIRGTEPGRELQSRLDRAIEYHGKNPDALIVVSGGKGADESVSEAEVMKTYLLKNGIPADLIIKEDRSSSTLENFTFSKDILDQRFGSEYRIAYVTNDFHILRAGYLANDVGFSQVGHLHSKIPIVSVLPCGLRESLALLSYIVF